MNSNRVNAAFKKGKTLKTNVDYRDLVSSVMGAENLSDSDWETLCKEGQEGAIQNYLRRNPELVTEIE
jgi:hypothetical protein